jgi:hypothetical protein
MISAAVPFECRRDFIEGLLLPGIAEWTGRSVLVVGDDEAAAQAIAAQLPEATVTCERAEPEAGAGHDLVLFRGRSLPPGAATAKLFGAAVGAMADDGAMLASLPAKHGLYPLALVAGVVRRFLPHRGGMEPAAVARRVIDTLPRGHHFRLRDQYMEELVQGGDDAFAALSGVSPEGHYEVSEVHALIGSCGVSFGGWLWPAVYNPCRCAEDPVASEVLARLEEPRKSTVADLITAGPTVHHFAVVKHGRVPAEPDWGTDAALSWRPMRLSAYSWARIGLGGPSQWTLDPYPRSEFTGRVELRPWHARLCMAADGRQSAAELLDVPEVRRALDIPKAEWSSAALAFLRDALELRVVAMLPP